MIFINSCLSENIYIKHEKNSYCVCVSAETLVNVLDFKKDVGLWHGVLTVIILRYS